MYRIHIRMFEKKHVFDLDCTAQLPNSPRPFLPSSLSKTLRRLWEVILLVNMTRKAADVTTQASSSSRENLPMSRNNVDYITRVVLC